jgi:Mg2+ and Co2+ transporter CorA
MAKAKQYVVVSNDELIDQIYRSIADAQKDINESYYDADDGIELTIYELVPVSKGEVIHSTKVVWKKE